MTRWLVLPLLALLLTPPRSHRESRSDPLAS